ncbi:lipopolysaccharide core biosynthesis protein RfaZ [Leminorella grimontii]|uniref:Lipopolysaccharide core biosynthesis protein RfaZ n=1 Tax=Leminorella grimontii TaxID=82981 RepID=A0AAV5N517_9GAMM|nr:3-deoxy-D-manno-oct-2-ulosonate III transferase WaaZ [Leminorella grimontii]KFC98462.1 RfaZ family lipopolysaccharide core biosynthesis protein [Leminorella grimontii ATCC 33999 = DSM 5078]GKX57191.1 lipopolysaccharide core biosynthesis protein RfaZ [Leminorella grimontii]VFS56029.1 lipopolysaccharide core biosynthesis protein [Leminorella grimontii]
MNNNIFITRKNIDEIILKKNSKDVIIFLSGPTSKKTPLSLLNSNDVVAVNGSAGYLIENKIKPFIYVLTDFRFLEKRRKDFLQFVENSQFTIVNDDVYNHAPESDKKYILENCLIIRSFYKREKGGALKKLKFEYIKRKNNAILIDVPFSKRKRLTGFCLDISYGYCSCHTVAFAAIQICYSLGYSRIICSGLDLTGGCQRFYAEDNPLPSELSNDLWKILPFFSFMKRNVPNINVYNLSDDTAISYDVIPHINSYEI